MTSYADPIRHRRTMLSRFFGSLGTTMLLKELLLTTVLLTTVLLTTSVLASVLLTTSVLASASPTAAASRSPLGQSVAVVLEPTTRSVVLGENFDLTVSVTNNGTTGLAPIVVHLDVIDPAQETSVDPEDWTVVLSQTVAELSPGQSTTLRWNLQPISAGRFVAYAVVLAAQENTVATSTLLEVQVEDQRSLNPGGILPIAIGVPAAIGALLILQLSIARRVRVAADGMV